jgi:hypothetical protein
MNLSESVRRMLDLAKQGPQPFASLAALVTAVYGETSPHTEADIVRAIEAEGEGGVVRLTLGAQLARWDADTTSSWSAATPRNSVARRFAIYDLMALSQEARSAFDDKMPRYDAQKPTVITAAGWTPWYVGERRTERTFYWDALGSNRCGGLSIQGLGRWIRPERKDSEHHWRDRKGCRCGLSACHRSGRNTQPSTRTDSTTYRSRTGWDGDAGGRIPR